MHKENLALKSIIGIVTVTSGDIINIDYSNGCTIVKKPKKDTLVHRRDSYSYKFERLT